MTADESAPLSRAQQRAKDAAERAEFDALITRLRAHNPHFDCLCGSLDDSSRTVADLDRHAQRQEPRGTRAESASTRRVFRAPQLGARVAVARAARRAGHGEVADLAARRDQLNHWHRDDIRRPATEQGAQQSTDDSDDPSMAVRSVSGGQVDE